MQKDGTERKFNFTGKKAAFAYVGLFIAGVILITFIVLSLKVSAYDKIFPNVIAGGINLGGTTREEARELLEKEFQEGFSEKVFVLKLQEKSLDFNPNDVDAEVDIEKTVEDAYDYGKKGNVFTKILKYIKANGTPQEFELQAKLSEEKAKELISQIAEGKEVPVKETEYSLEGDVLTIKNGHEGICVDREKAVKKIKDTLFSKASRDVELNLEDAKPKKVDLDKLYEEITKGKKNAFYAREDGQIVVKDGFPEVKIDKNDLKMALESGQETFDIKAEVTPPEVSAEELRKKLFRDEMGSWTSYFSGSNVPRSQNVRLSASRINGVTLMPGESFSYDKTIGSRTAANGYKTATVYVGNTMEDGIGGGICQTSSTLYSAVLYANLEIVSRTSHSLPVSYMPAGQDATIAEGYIDFVFKNNTDYPVKIICTTNYGSVRCSIMGVKPDGEKVSVVNTKVSSSEPKKTRKLNDEIPKGYKKTVQKGVGGYTVASQRIVTINGVEKKRENLTKSVYRAQDEIIEVNSLDKDTPFEALVEYDERAFEVSANPEEIAPEPEESLPETEAKTETSVPETEENVLAEDEQTEEQQGGQI